jgi:hypothetical protein
MLPHFGRTGAAHDGHVPCKPFAASARPEAVSAYITAAAG